MPKETLSSTIAQRLVRLRKTAGLTRKEIEIKYGIKNPSLRSWEIGTRTLKRRNAETLASIFKNHGINCTVEWLLEGNGTDPLEVASQATEEAYILKEIYRFESFHKDSTVLCVSDDYMAPWLRKGDFVGGVFKKQLNQESFVGRICIVKTREFGTQIRLVKEGENKQHYNLISFSGKGDILNAKIEAAAVIIFFRGVEGQELAITSKNPL